MPDEYCFQSKAERCWEGNTSYTSPFKGKVPGKLLKPRSRTRAALCTGIKQISFLWEHLAEQHQNSCETQLGTFGEYCKCTFWSTNITGGPCVSPCYLHLETETGTEIPHQAKSCGPVHTTADLLNDWCWYHTSQPDKAQCTNTVLRFVSRDILLWLWTAGSLFCMQETPQEICSGSLAVHSPSHSWVTCKGCSKTCTQD